MLPLSIRKWLAYGSGAGIEIGPANLTVSVVRVKPSGAKLAGSTVIENFRERPAAEWGRQYSEFLKSHGVGHLAAAVLLPRNEVIVRTMPFPGVKDEELAAAVGYQLDALHPYGEDDAAVAWSRLDASNVLLGVARRQTLDHYISLFAEAGVKVATFTFSAACLRSALRMVDAPPDSVLAGIDTAEGFEVYGESEAKPVFSAVFDMAPERALAFAAAELRLPADTTPSELGVSLSHAAAMTSACPNFALDANLLPEAQRRSTSKLRYVPTAVLATALAGLCAASVFHQPYDERVYREALLREIKQVEKLSGRVPALDKNLAQTRARVELIDEFRKRTGSDLDLLLELTTTLAPPAFASSVDITRETVTIAGEAEQAAILLRLFDNSPRLAGSEFTVPIARLAASESFRVRSQRETAPVAVTQGAPAKP